LVRAKSATGVPCNSRTISATICALLIRALCRRYYKLQVAWCVSANCPVPSPSGRLPLPPQAQG
jgi:hypothetical protein